MSVNAFRVVQDTLTRTQRLIHQNAAHCIGSGKRQLVWSGISQTDGQTALRVTVDQQHLLSGLRQPDAQVCAGGYLANAAFLDKVEYVRYRYSAFSNIGV